MKAKVNRQKAKARRTFLPTFAFALSTFALLSACAVDERRGVPTGAQEVVDRVTEDVAAGRDDKIYAESAPEWREAVSAEESAKMVARVRDRLGRVESRTLYSGRDRQHAAGRLTGHALELVYQTSFERGPGMEKFTLVERDGRWQLAGYSVSSEALR